MTRPQILVTRATFAETLERLARHFEVEPNPDDTIWAGAALAQRLQGKQGALTTGSERIDAALLAACPQLQICANMIVGYNNFDVQAMAARGVVGTNTPDVLTETTADFGLALILAAARRLTESERFLRRGEWRKPDYHRLFAGAEVHGSTLGIIGMGRIGQAIARRGARGFGMTVLYHNRSRLAADTESLCGARYVTKDALLRSADHVLLVLPYSAAAHHTIGAAELAQMKPTATLTNLARGGIVDDAALARALREGRLAAAALDVFEGEPAVHPELLALPNVVLTPHIASATLTTRRAMAELAADNLIAFFEQGRAITPVTPMASSAAAPHPSNHKEPT
jgi:gluconate 2-dehydrogenase